MSALPGPDGPAEGSHPVIQGPDLTSDSRSGRIGARWEEVYPRCDKEDPRKTPGEDPRPSPRPTAPDPPALTCSRAPGKVGAHILWSETGRASLVGGDPA